MTITRDGLVPGTDGLQNLRRQADDAFSLKVRTPPTSPNHARRRDYPFAQNLSNIRYRNMLAAKKTTTSRADKDAELRYKLMIPRVLLCQCQRQRKQARHAQKQHVSTASDAVIATIHASQTEVATMAMVSTATCDSMAQDSDITKPEEPDQ